MTYPVQNGLALAEERMLIGGELVNSRSGRTFQNINPATEEVLGITTDATREEMEEAIASARRAFDETDWSRNHAFRRRCLEQLHAALDAAREDVRNLTIAEVGAPWLLTLGIQCDVAIDQILYYAKLATDFQYEKTLPNTMSFGVPNRRKTVREATGVVGAISPWNYPLLMNLTKIIPALAAGNTVVLKPAPDTPWSATLLGHLIATKTDFPKGVINIVTSSDHLVGEVLTTDPRVDLVTFTGSTATGRRVMACGAQTLKKVFLELGGKSPCIVLDDADFNLVAQKHAIETCSHAGQGCALQTRVLMPRSRYEEGVEAYAQVMRAVPYGDPTRHDVVQGPQISARQFERVTGYINKGVAEGARLVTGGKRPEHLQKGYFVEPTLFADVTPTMTIAQEEIFGPVIVMIPYDDEDDAIRIANGTIYGLGGGVWSPNEERALKIGARIRSGTVTINGGYWYHVDTPFGGMKQSGVGRENGETGFEEYLEIKSYGLPA